MGLIGKFDDSGNGKVRGLKVGEIGYVSSTITLALDECGGGYLNLDADVMGESSTIYSMPITRTGVGKSDYDVDVSGINRSCFIEVKKDYEGNPFGGFTEDRYVVYLPNSLDTVTEEDM